jgi:hypothetical protein
MKKAYRSYGTAPRELLLGIMLKREMTEKGKKAYFKK